MSNRSGWSHESLHWTPISSSTRLSTRDELKLVTPSKWGLSWRILRHAGCDVNHKMRILVVLRGAVERSPTKVGS
jgi:hypothetical protein